MPFNATPSKRPLDRNPLDSNRKLKWIRPDAGLAQVQPLKAGSTSVVFRVLCPVPSGGCVIGKDSAILSRICDETGANVRIEEPVGGDEEQIIVIMESVKEGGIRNERKYDRVDKGNVSADGKVNNIDSFANDDVDIAKVAEENNTGGPDESEVGLKEDGKNRSEGDNESEEFVKEDEKNGSDSDDESDADADGGEEVKKGGETNYEKVMAASLAPIEELSSIKVSSFAQKALLYVFERMVIAKDHVKGNGIVDGESEKAFPTYNVRLLVLSTQVGFLLGKDETLIKQMAVESGAQICVLPKDRLPECVTYSDELVQITGELDAARKALLSVSQQLMAIQHRKLDSVPQIKLTSSSANQPGSFFKSVHHPKKHHLPAQGTLFTSGLQDRPNVIPSNPKFQESSILSTPSSILGRDRPSLDISFKLICHSDKVGGLIGKGGSIVRILEYETGCAIKVLDCGAISEDRIVAITGPAHLSDRISPVEDAVLRVQSRLVMGTPTTDENAVTVKLLILNRQLSCLIGQGGSIISEMRRLSGAHIRVLVKNQVPSFVSADQEIIQATGQFEIVQEALLQILTRLRYHHFGDAVPTNNNRFHPNFLVQASPFLSFVGRREPSLPQMLPNMRPSFNKFGSVGGVNSHRPMYPQDDRPAFAHTNQGPGFHFHSFERDPSSVPWEPRNISDGRGSVGNSYPDGGLHQQKRTRIFGGATNPAIITSTIMEVAIPKAVVASICGEGGSSLKRLRQISGAKITIGEPIVGATESKITISGTPEQTHAAQSLLQAFVLSESDSH